MHDCDVGDVGPAQPNSSIVPYPRAKDALLSTATTPKLELALSASEIELALSASEILPPLSMNHRARTFYNASVGAKSMTAV